jgi:hypothetical protein
MTYQQHPLSAAFPAMSDEDFAVLKEDIKAHGQREPIIVHEGMVLDGWHRFRACTELGIEPLKFTFSTADDPVSFVLSHNLHRRHLTPSQRAAAVVACSTWAPVGKVKPEMVSGLRRDADMAKMAGTSDRTIRDAKVAHKAGLGEMVKAGALTANEAAQVARGVEPKKAKRTLVQEEQKADANDQLAEAQHAITDLAAENERLSDRLAVEAMDASEEEKTAAANTIAELRHQVQALEAELNAVKVSRDTYMRENGELKNQIKMMRRQAEKAAA